MRRVEEDEDGAPASDRRTRRTIHAIAVARLSWVAHEPAHAVPPQRMNGWTRALDSHAQTSRQSAHSGSVRRACRPLAAPERAASGTA
jgi:hypothetical protein